MKFFRNLSWWLNLGYMNYRKDNYKVVGVKPWGQRWFYIVIADSDTAEKVVKE